MQALDKLAGAIVELAVSDYRRAYKLQLRTGNTNLRSLKELQKFFRSPWFTVLAEADGERAMRLIEKNCDVKNVRREEKQRRRKYD